MTFRSLAVRAAVVTACLGLVACDKIRSLAGKDDGGSSGGGLFSFFDSSFEGEVTMTASSKTSKSVPTTMVFGLKSPKVRIDAAPQGGGNPMLAAGGSFIIDPPQKKGYALIHAQKKAMVIDFDKAKGTRFPQLGGNPSQAPNAPSDPPKIEKTGKKDTVAGYQCEIWNVTNKTARAELCVAEGITWIDVADLGLQAPEFAAAAALSGLNHFPLRVVSYDAANTETSRFEATKIEKKKLDDSRFTVPPDYQVVDIAQLLAPAISSARGLPPGFTIPSGIVPPRKPPR